jgi:hypothetical protein
MYGSPGGVNIVLSEYLTIHQYPYTIRLSVGIQGISYAAPESLHMLTILTSLIDSISDYAALFFADMLYRPCMIVTGSANG